MYRTAPQIVFQFVGGFSIAQYALPILSDSFRRQPTQSASDNFPYKETLSNAWGKVKVKVEVRGLARPHSMSEDIESTIASYRVVSAALLTLIVVSGGAPALIGAGISYYFGDTPEGNAHYEKAKAKWRDFNK